jgi:hypothetical protein
MRSSPWTCVPRPSSLHRRATSGVLRRPTREVHRPKARSSGRWGAHLVFGLRLHYLIGLAAQRPFVKRFCGLVDDRDHEHQAERPPEPVPEFRPARAPNLGLAQKLAARIAQRHVSSGGRGARLAIGLQLHSPIGFAAQRPFAKRFCGLVDDRDTEHRLMRDRSPGGCCHDADAAFTVIQTTIMVASLAAAVKSAIRRSNG